MLIIDMINTFDFEGGALLARQAARAARRISLLRDRCARDKIPVIYCNDNFGKWRSDFRAVFERSAMPGSRGAAIAAQLRPQPGDYFVLKPKHSAFFATPLELLLEHMRVHRLIVTGIAGDGCVLCTANDAHIREYAITIVADATASQRAASNRRALAHLEESIHAEIRTTAALIRSNFS